MERYKVTALSNDRARLIERVATFSHMIEADFIADHWVDNGFLVIVRDEETGRETRLNWSVPA